jgi:signal transduction histidine kinase
MEFFRNLLSSNGFTSHGYCYMWRPGVVWLHVVSDVLIALAYLSIPFTLIYFIRKRRDVPFNWIFVCFGLFIFACGATHAMEVWTLWHATYWLSGAVKGITALFSVPTAILLIQSVPLALELPSPKALRLEIAERTSAQEALLAEIAERKQTQEKLRRSEEELHSLAGRLITVQENERKRIARDLHEDFSQRLALHCVELDLQRHRLPVGSDMARELERLLSDAETLTCEVRQIAHDLHHPQLSLGLQNAATSLCREFSEHHGIAVELLHESNLERIPATVSIVLFRVLQEALSNVAKHSAADRVTVSISVGNDQALMCVTDRGRGFETKGVQSDGGLGLIGMRERLRLVRGTMSVTSSPGRGAEIEAVVPITMPERSTSTYYA